MPDRTFTQNAAKFGNADINEIMEHARAYGITIISTTYNESTKVWSVTVNAPNPLLNQFAAEQAEHLGVV